MQNPMHADLHALNIEFHCYSSMHAQYYVNMCRCDPLRETKHNAQAKIVAHARCMIFVINLFWYTGRFYNYIWINRAAIVLLICIMYYR